MTGLEAGGAVYGKRSCFKASSGDHPNRDKHTEPKCIVLAPGVGARYFLIFGVQIFINAGFEAKGAERR